MIGAFTQCLSNLRQLHLGLNVTPIKINTIRPIAGKIPTVDQQVRRGASALAVDHLRFLGRPVQNPECDSGPARRADTTCTPMSRLDNEIFFDPSLPE